MKTDEKKKLEEIFIRLNKIKNQAEAMREESFDKARAFRFVYASLLDLLDSLDYLKESEELFDDDFFRNKEIEIKSDFLFEEEEEFKPKHFIDPDDLI